MSFDLKIVNGDLSIKNGDLDTINGKDKLIQDVLKIVLTEVGSNPFNPWYGSYVSRTLIGSYLDSDIVLSAAKNQLQIAIENLKALQQKQLESGQKMSPEEQISVILNVIVDRNAFDPRLFEVVIKILNKSFGKVDTSFRVSNI